MQQEELRKQYRCMTFHQTEKPEEPKHILDQIKDKTNSWKVALRKTRNLTR